MTDLKLLLIGASVFQRNTEGELTSKRLVVDYVEGFTKYFKKVFWATELFEGETHTQALIDLRKITPCILNGRARGIFTDYLKLRHIIDRDTIIFLHLPNPWITLPVLALRRRARALFVYVANDYIQHSKLSRKSRGVIYSILYRFIHELPIRLADGVIVRGSLNLERAYKLNNNVLKTLPIGLTVALHKRTKEPFSSSSVRLLYVGKLVEGKGVEILLKAFAGLLEQFADKDLSLFIVGTGPKEGKLKELSLSLGIAEKVKFLGFIDDKHELSKLYAEADVLVVPSTYYYPEGVPRVIDEALAHGTPVIASALAGISREFSNDEIALVCPGEVQDLQSVLQNIICDEQFRRKQILAAKKYQEDLVAWPTAAEQHSRFIIMVITRGRRK